MIPGALYLAALDRRLTHQDLRILAVLHQHMDPVEYRPVKLAWLAHLAGLQRQNVRRSLVRLVQTSYLMREAATGNDVVGYRLSNPRVGAQPVISALITPPTD